MLYRLFTVITAFILAATAFAGIVVGDTAVELSGQQINVRETNTGDFLADAIKNISGADIALLPSMVIKDSVTISKGQVDEQMLRGLLSSPSSPIVILTMKSSLLRTMLERSVSKVPDPNTAFLQISGIEVTFDSSKPSGSRIATIKLHGKVLADDKTTLTVAMPRELGLGGAGYLRIIPDSVIGAMTTTDYSVMDAIKHEFSRLGGKVTPSVDGRLTDKAK
ncbi:MAG TPA: 5'-nucleotidase [Armatimonadota bacterium]|nr:5'-nucleotidase [Armatimonadota bacterium]